MNGMIFTAYNRTLCTRCSNQILCKKHYFSYFLLLLSTAICVSLLLRCEIISYSSCNIDVTKWPSHLFPEMCLQIKNINFSHRRTIELDFLEREKKRTNQQKKYACEISNLINHLRQFFTVSWNALDLNRTRKTPAC